MDRQKNNCGLDFSKAVVIINEEKYIDKFHKPQIRQNEFNALKGNEQIVYSKMLKYIRQYKKAKQNQNVKPNQILCKYSTLQYFENYI